MNIVSNAKLLCKTDLSQLYLTPKNTIIKEVCKRINYKMEKYSLEKLNNKNITPKLLSIIEEDYFIYFEMEYMKGGDLLEYILMRNYKPYFDEASLEPIAQKPDFTTNNKFLLKSMIDLLSKMRDESIIHLDVKPENFIFTDTNRNDLKIIDFGSSQTYNFEKKNELRLSSMIGTRFYTPPEYCLDNFIVYNSDVWSLGVMMLIFETGKQIYQKNRNYELSHIEKQETLDIIIDEYVLENTESNDLIKNMLKLDYRERYDYDDILTHSYLN